MAINTNYNNNVDYLFGSTSTSSSNQVSSYQTSKDNLMATVLSQYGANTSTLTSDLQDYLKSIKDAGTQLKKDLLSLSDPTMYNKVKTQASDTSIMSIALGKDAEVSSYLKEADITVEQLATAQQNKGASLAADGRVLGSYNSYDMTIKTADGKEHDFSINTTSSMTNKEAQEALAEKINKSDMGVTAKVEYDSKTNKSTLVLTGDETGANNNFSVSGELASKFGVGTATQKAQDAIYTVGGQIKTSASNTVELEEGVKATFKKVTEDEPVRLVEKTDNTDAMNAVRSVVNQFNKLMEAASDSMESDSGASKLYDQLSALSDTYKDLLGGVGISANEKGYLEIDEKKMAEAAESGALERVLTDGEGQSYGFMGRLSNIADKVSDDPTSYLSRESKMTIKDATEGDYFNGSQNASYVSALNRAYNNGMLFDSLF